MLNKTLDTNKILLFQIDKLNDKTSHLYIATNFKYWRKLLFKIGITDNTKRRKIQLNTSHPQSDVLTMIDIIPIIGGRKTEEMIEYFLKPFRENIKKEWYIEEIIPIIKMICLNSTNFINLYNQQIEKLHRNLNEYDGITNIKDKYQALLDKNGIEVVENHDDDGNSFVIEQDEFTQNTIDKTKNMILQQAKKARNGKQFASASNLKQFVQRINQQNNNNNKNNKQKLTIIKLSKKKSKRKN